MAKELTRDDKRELLRIARSTITEYLESGHVPPGRPHKESLLQPAGCFVTLKRKADHALRGCIGTFSTNQPLYRAVQEMAVAAATRDPRFPAVTLDELDDLVLEISVLTPPRPARPEEVEVGRHGLEIELGPFHGVLLPQVAVEEGWDRKTFLEAVCMKAGLPPDAYESPHAKLSVFTAEVFSEEDLADETRES